MNTVNLVGRLVKDPELNITQGGKAVCNMRVAVDDVFSAEDRADFLNVSVWGKQAENCSKYLQKGSRAGVEGRLRTDSYTDAEGIKRYPVTVVANRVEFLSSLRERNIERPAEQGHHEAGKGTDGEAAFPDAAGMEPPEEGPELGM
jgi:single-strand DNA-binding protein